MEDNDQAAKNQARRESQSTRPGAFSQEAGRPNDRAATKTATGAKPGDNGGRPGARSIAAEEVARLDERIASKKDRRSTRDTQIRDNASTSQQLVQLEQQVAAKTRTSEERASHPGAVPVNTRTDLAQLEREVASKTNVSRRHQAEDSIQMEGNTASAARTRSSRESGRAKLNQLDREIESKKVERNNREVSQNRARLNQLENDLVSKNQARNEITSGETRAPSSQLDRDAEAKNRAAQESALGTSVGVSHVQTVPTVGGKTALQDDEVLRKTRSAQRSQRNQPTNDEELSVGEVDEIVQVSNTGVQNHVLEDLAKEDPNDVPMKSPIDPDSLPHGGRGIISDPDVEFGSLENGGGQVYDQGLAVAVAISTEEEDAFIPAAVEYEPDAKPPIFRNRRFRLYAFSALVLAVVIVTATVIIVVTRPASPGPAPTPAPTTLRETIGIQEQLVAVVGAEKLNDRGSPHWKAADWLINRDPMQLLPDADNLIQRYLLALFYYDTTQVNKWLSCNPPDEEAGEDEACTFKKLVHAFPAFVYEDIPWYRWLSGAPECLWAGIFCDEFNQTRAIELVGQEILGTIPTDVAQMPYLQSLALTWNHLGGTLPSHLAAMKHLLNIEMHYNFFTGQVPPEWYSAQALQRINVAANLLSGSVPTEIGRLSTMKGFFSFENSLTGTIPTEVGNMKFLSFTRWGRNFFTGQLPTEFGKLEKLQEAWVHRCDLTGTLPSELGNMRDMADLRLHFNKIKGSIPEEMYNMMQVKRLDLYDCALTGTISTNIKNMKNLQTFRVRTNQLTGTIPVEMGANRFLETVWLQKNKLSGDMPLEICALRGPRGLQVLNADCGGDPSRINCVPGCCTTCCEFETGFCLVDEEA